MQETVGRLDPNRMSLAGTAVHLEIAPMPGSVDITDRKPSQPSIDIVKADVAKALAAVDDSAWLRPRLYVNRNLENVPEKVVAANTLVEKLVSLGHHSTVVRWAVYDCIESGNLRAAVLERNVVHHSAKGREQAKRKAANETAASHQTVGAPAYVGPLYVWPTSQAVRQPKTEPEEQAILDERLSKLLTKDEAAKLHAGEPIKNPTAYFNRLIKQGKITPPVGEKYGHEWQFYLRDFPEGRARRDAWSPAAKNLARSLALSPFPSTVYLRRESVLRSASACVTLASRVYQPCLRASAMVRKLPKRTTTTPPRLATKWGVSPSKVIAFIKSGELKAFNISKYRHNRPRYLIELATSKNSNAPDRSFLIGATPPSDAFADMPLRGLKSFFEHRSHVSKRAVSGQQIALRT